MVPTVQQLCEAMAWTAEHVLLPELRSSHARIQARELAKLLRWLGSATEERREIAEARSERLRTGLGRVAAALRPCPSSRARALAEEIEAYVATAPDARAPAEDAERGRRLQARVVPLLDELDGARAATLAAELRAAIAEDVMAEISAGLPPSSFEELTRADREQEELGARHAAPSAAER